MQPNDTSLCSNLLTLPVPEQIAVICVTDGGDSFTGANKDVWRSITVDGPGVLSLTTCDIDGDDTDLAVWDACVDGSDDSSIWMRDFLKSLRWERVAMDRLEWFDEGGVSLLQYAVMQNNAHVVKRLLG